MLNHLQALDICKKYGTQECVAYRRHIFNSHKFLSLSLARNYVKVAEEHGYAEANRQLGKLHKTLCLGNQFHGLFIDSPDEEVKTFAARKSLATIKLFSVTSKNLGSANAIKKVMNLVEECGLEFPLEDIEKASPEKIASAIARCCCEDWWRLKIRRLQDIVLEQVQIQMGLVNKDKGIYSSNYTVERKKAQWKRNEFILASLVAENDLGQSFTLLELAKRGVSNLTNRRNELMTRLSGFEAIAKDRGDIGMFYTLTAPSKYHAFRAKPCKPNPKYQGATPAETQAYMNKIWQRFRAKLKRLGIQPYGFRVVEPHHDGTPHWHILLFMPQKDVRAVTATLRHYALEEDGNEPGAQLKRVKTEYIDPAKGTAVGYIAKYISKNIDGEHVGEDLYGKDAITSALRIRAWASTWNIRQFQSIGGPSVTVWREARRFATSEAADKMLKAIDDETLGQIIDAADQGDWKTFVELMGGPTALRKDQPLRASHVASEAPNKYGEAVNKILGMMYRGAQEIKTRLRTWTVSRIDQISSSKQDSSSSFIGGANAPPLEFCQ